MSTSGRRLDRDRDDEGRANNARPRDALGRPLPPGSKGIDRIPEDLVLPPAESLSWAQDLLDRGLAFNAHEVLEDQWKATEGDERALWQGLAQLAVGLTHQRRGNLRGATAVTTRGADAVAGYRDAPPHGIDAAGLVAWARDLAARPESDVPVPRLLR